jgi:hypothetical protein
MLNGFKMRSEGARTRTGEHEGKPGANLVRVPPRVVELEEDLVDDAEAGLPDRLQLPVWGRFYESVSDEILKRRLL